MTTQETINTIAQARNNWPMLLRGAGFTVTGNPHGRLIAKYPQPTPTGQAVINCTNLTPADIIALIGF